MASRLSLFVANAAWFLRCVPGALAFRAALARPESAQRRLLRRMLADWRETRYGREVGGGAGLRTPSDVQRLPIADYDTFRPYVRAIQSGEAGVLTVEPVIMLQPTSGTGAAPKLIPYTRGLQRQFQAALAPWIASVFMRRPRLLFGRQYWCLSPNTSPRADGRSAVPIGFADDVDYLGARLRGLARRLFVAPDELARVDDPRAFEFLTLLFLVQEPNLRLISIWHPSFLTVLLKALPGHVPALEACLKRGELPHDLAVSPALRAALAKHLRPNPHRAAQVAQMNLEGAAGARALWPHLQVISCWGGREAEPWLASLRMWFPGVLIQAKGLIATEGVVSIPWGSEGRFACAVRSHFLEFAVPGSTDVRRCWDVEPGKTYEVVMTTAGGLWRYRLGDLVRVVGWTGRTPMIDFVRRTGLVSDLCGEKLTLADAEAAIDHARDVTGVDFRFAMLVPRRLADAAGYQLLAQPTAGTTPSSLAAAANEIEAALQRNFQYRHARGLGQLQPVRIRVIRGDADRQYREHLLRSGARHGDIKCPALRVEPGWPAAFELEPDESSTPSQV